MLVSSKPAGLDSGNDLDKLPDDLLGGPPPPADIILASKTLTTLVDPPDPGETVVLMVRVRVYDIGKTYGDNGEGDPTHYRKTKLVTCWLPGDPEPLPTKTKAEEEAEAAAEAAENQPSLYDDLGQPFDAEYGDGVDRPEFSGGEDS